MTDRTERAPSAFRLNLEQQKNRAKDLLRATKSGDANALARVAAVTGHAAGQALKLADAQFVIARELRFPNWAKLKAHINALDRQRGAIDGREAASDGDVRTLHIRCGSDIQWTLVDAGFIGDFLEHATPYCLGPVTNGPDRHERMARFLIDSVGESRPDLEFSSLLARLQQGDESLTRSADGYERVVIWTEHDSWDQLVLARVLAHYANAKRPRALELVAVDEFPGAERYIGIGQLPAEALRLLWSSRVPVTPPQLALGADVWTALTSGDPRGLATLARSGTPMLPIMAPALHRHLRELPSVENGLSLTQQLSLRILADAGGPLTLNRLFFTLQREVEPLPFMPDLGFLHVIEQMLTVAEPVLTRVPAPTGARPFAQELTITDLGRAVVRGERDWLQLRPPERWVGGVCVRPDAAIWRWDEARREARLT